MLMKSLFYDFESSKNWLQWYAKIFPPENCVGLLHWDWALWTFYCMSWVNCTIVATTSTSKLFLFLHQKTSCEYNYNIFNCRVLYFNGNNVILNVERFAKNVEFSRCIWQIALLNQSKWSKLNKTIKYFECLQMLMPA